MKRPGKGTSNLQSTSMHAIIGNWMKLAETGLRFSRNYTHGNQPSLPTFYGSCRHQTSLSYGWDSLSTADEEQWICLLRAQPFLELASIVGWQPIVPSKGCLSMSNLIRKYHNARKKAEKRAVYSYFDFSNHCFMTNTSFDFHTHPNILWQRA